MEPLTQAQLEERLRRELKWVEDRKDSVYSHFSLSYRGCSAEEKWIEISYTASEWAKNPSGTFQGGVSAFLLDMAMAICSRCFSGAPSTPTLDLHVNYLHAITIGTDVVIRAEAKRVGRKIANIYGEISDAQSGQLYVSATANEYIRAVRS